MPHSGIGNKIPDEIYYKRKVDIKYLRVWGCITYYKDFSQNKGKFSPNAKKGIFLGFNQNSHCYIIMDYEDHKIHHVREIYCLEDTPSSLRLPNTHQNEFNDPNFLNFDFHFTNKNSNEQELNDNYTQNNYENYENEINLNNEKIILISDKSSDDPDVSIKDNINNKDEEKIYILKPL